ncbi:MAG: phytanoyl-CoA dioxygenase family protein [Myxococcota bacterium]
MESTARPTLDDADLKRFRDEGWLLVRDLLPHDICDPIVQAFVDEVKPYDGPLLRQLTSVDEPHQLSEDGWMVNPVVNPYQRPQFERFSTIEWVAMSNAPVVDHVTRLLGGAPAMLQSAYYESSRGTHTHLDFNPVDRARPMIGLWIALEDIGPGAGRFHVVPRSHRLPMDARMARFAELAWANYRQAFIELDPKTAEAEAQALLAEILDEHGLVREAPALRKGDAILWTNLLLHGSDVPVRGGGTRHSLLFHFVELDLLRQHGLTNA